MSFMHSNAPLLFSPVHPTYNENERCSEKASGVCFNLRIYDQVVRVDARCKLHVTQHSMHYKQNIHCMIANLVLLHLLLN